MSKNYLNTFIYEKRILPLEYVYKKNIFYILSLLLKCEFICDRYNILNNNYSTFNIKLNKNDIPPNFNESLNFNMSFNDICLKRSEFILKNNKKIGLFWSGGVDSTCILCSLLQTINDKNKLHLFLGNSSIQEYPLFYNKYIKNNLSYTLITKDNIENIFTDEYLYIDGSCGDQLISSFIFLIYPELYYKDWKESFNIILNDLGLKNNDIDKYIDILNNYFSILNIKNIIVKTNIFMWFISFVFKWIYVQNNISFTFGSVNIINNYISFFNSIDFEKWSISNFEKNNIYNFFIKDNYKYYKYEYKKFIYEFTKDKVYFKNKHKEPSLVKFLDEQKYYNNNKSGIILLKTTEKNIINKINITLSKNKKLVYIYKLIKDFLNPDCITDDIVIKNNNLYCYL